MTVDVEMILAGYWLGLFIGTVSALLGYIIKSVFRWMLGQA